MPMRFQPVTGFCVIATMLVGLLATASYSAPIAPAAGGKPIAKPGIKKPAIWMDSFNLAQKKAQKEEKPMLLYFCASDWDDWTMKLEEEVMQTALWTDWATQNFILVKVDYPKNVKNQRADVKAQNDIMKTRFNVAKVPTFIFLDPWGDLLARVGYNTAKLRDDETKDQPKKWLEFCQNVVASRPVKEKLIQQTDLMAAVASVKKTAIPLCILVTQGLESNQIGTQQRDTLLQNQLFVRFINRNMGFVEAKWPEESDTGQKAKELRDFAAKWKFGPAPWQLVIWDPGGIGQNKAIIGAFDSLDCGPLVKRLEPLLPSIDYGGGWLDNYKTAKSLAAQQQKDLLISFVCTDGSEFSKKMDAEIYTQPEFKDYSKKNMILLRVDFPKDPALLAKQGKDMQEQNNMLAEMFGVRGYPTVIIVNPKGQKILDGKYMKGGAPTFVAEVKKQIQKDKDRRTLISQEVAKDLEKNQ